MLDEDLTAQFDPELCGKMSETEAGPEVWAARSSWSLAFSPALAPAAIRVTAPQGEGGVRLGSLPVTLTA